MSKLLKMFGRILLVLVTILAGDDFQVTHISLRRVSFLYLLIYTLKLWKQSSKLGLDNTFDEISRKLLILSKRFRSDGRKWGQSPVDIDESTAVGIQFPALIMSSHWNKDGKAKMRNTGKTVRITLEGKRSPPTIQGGPLANDVYELSEVVFRWGSSNCKGAEHTLNGTWLTMEAQALHFNTRYGNIDDCWHKNDGIAICSYFLQVYQIPTWDEHPLFSNITDNLHKIIEPDSFTKLPPNCLSWMRQACESSGYYTYLGSTTTSPFRECVTWIVFPEAVRISENQAELFRLLRNKQGFCIKENYREVQKLNGRVIYYVS